MDNEKKKLDDEQLNKVSGGDSAWWTNDDPTYMYICNRWVLPHFY